MGNTCKTKSKLDKYPETEAEKKNMTRPFVAERFPKQ